MVCSEAKAKRLVVFQYRESLYEPLTASAGAEAVFCRCVVIKSYIVFSSSIQAPMGL